MFKDQNEYNQFRAWVIEGSCLGQRMAESNGGEFEIPLHWKTYKQKADELGIDPPEQLPEPMKK
jgi:hypothetical protein